MNFQDMDFRHLPTDIRNRVERRLISRGVDVYLRIRASPTVCDPHHALDRIDSGSTLLFLCWGNICRSPMAARYAQQVASDRGLSVAAHDAGFSRLEGRESPDVAVDVADTYGVDLSDHRSREVTHAQVAASDVVFLMDRINYLNARRDYPAHRERLSFLGAFSDADRVIIPDPFGERRPAFQQRYATITDAVNTLFDRIADRT